MVEVGKYYTAKPEFTADVSRARENGRRGSSPYKMSGKCIQITERLVTLEFRFGNSVIRESFRHDEVS